MRAGERASDHPAVAWQRIAEHFFRGELEAARAIVETCTPTGTDSDAAMLHAWSAQVHRRLGAVDLAKQEAAAALALAETLGDDRALAAAHNVMGLVAGMDSDHETAERHLRVGLAAAERAGDTTTMVQILSSTGTMEFERSEFAAGIATYERAAELADREGFTPMLAQARMNLGLLKWSIGRLDEAAREYADSIALYRASSSREVAYAIVGKGDVHRERGELALARAAYEEGLALAEASGDRQALVPALYQLAKVLVDDDPDQAVAYAQRAVDLGWPDLAWALCSLGWIQLARGDRAAALATGVHAAAVAREQHDRFGLADALSLQAMGSAGPALRRRLLGESRAAWRDLGDPFRGTVVDLALARGATGPKARSMAETAERRLRQMGAGLSSSGPAGLARFVAPDGERAPVEVRVLGGFQVLRDGVAVPQGAWQSRKARDLFKILVTRRGRPVSREVLGETLWPDDESDAVAGRLSVALSTLRSVLDPDHRYRADHFIAADASAVSLRSESVRVDVDVFFATVDAGLAASGEEACDLLEAAEATYGGELLEEDPSAEWAVALRERARAAYIRVSHALAALASERGDHQEAADLFLRILEREVYDERAHLGLVRALRAAGRHGEARRAHRTYESRMAEIGVKATPLPA